MNDSARIAIAAHLHVLLRRKTGRVTDTEWLATNAEYATEIIRFSREQSVERGAPELAEWADKLEQSAAKAATAPSPVPVLRSQLAPAAEAAAPKEPPPDPDLPRYVGGIR
jgi:hypothetical protein